MGKTLKGIALFSSLLYLSFYIPMALTFYLPWWMETNCAWHGRCESIGTERSTNGIEELASYFRHQTDELNTFFTNKEKLHMKEVRRIFDTIFIIAIISAVLLVTAFDRKKLPRYALINGVIVLCLLIVLPFFGTFWRDVFHPLMFDNDLWKNNKLDLSYYIMPRQFFKYTVALIVVSCFLINIAIWLGFRKKKKS